MLKIMFALGFRPFFLAAALLGALWLPLWLILYYGGALPHTPLPGTLWHGHEMIFGYAGAVIAGFLLTAARNWTGQDTATGRGLAGLVALWAASRLLNLWTLLPETALALIDPLFFAGLAVALFRPLWRTGNRRNLPLAAVVLAFGVLDGLTHLAAEGLTGTFPAGSALRIALDLVVVLMVVIGGRVMPMFTNNALPNTPARRLALLDRLSVAGVVAALLSEIAFGFGHMTGAVFVLAGIINLLRLSTWGGLQTLGKPILWVLHIGYLWIGTGMVLRGLSVFSVLIPETMGVHALTAGAIGTLTMGMMARVALGHTGRTIVGHPITAGAFVLVSLAAVLRVAAPLYLPGYDFAMMVSGALWTLAFGLFLSVYAPILAAPRVDGKPG